MIKITRQWCMPNSKTFKMLPLKEKILEYADKLKPEQVVIDPFANEHSIGEFIKCKYISNDIDNSYGCDYSLDAYDFLNQFEDESVDMILYDPPYSPRQVSECYTKLGKTVTMQDTSSGYYTKFKEQISRILKPNGIVITACWNTNGIGMKNGFEIIEIMLLAHGGAHNDTLITIERKVGNKKLLK